MRPAEAGPVLVSTRPELAAALDRVRRDGPIGFVPTMGALHAGHASLISLGRDRIGDGTMVVSIFVNPTQFGDTESGAADLVRYPRTLAADLGLCRTVGADIVFAPDLEVLYPGGSADHAVRGPAPRSTAPAGSGSPVGSPLGPVTIDPGPSGDILEGAARPGHFRGVLTVVAKLFGLVRPDLAVFGEKDFQQLALVRRMVADLNLGVEVVGAPTVREPDGLALSSRNRFLTVAQRVHARTLHRALGEAVAVAAAGAGLVAADAAARKVLADTPEVDVDYLTFTDPGLTPLSTRDASGGSGRVLVAARLGSVRLIDNCAITFPSPEVESADYESAPRPTGD
ncbi:MAG: pantoate--beta-alanine ligase [Nocardioides sp.]